MLRSRFPRNLFGLLIGFLLIVSSLSFGAQSASAYTPADLDVTIYEPVKNGLVAIEGIASYPEDGKPVAGGVVVVSDEDGNNLCSTTTKADGTWECVLSTPLLGVGEINAYVNDPATGRSGVDNALYGGDCFYDKPSIYLTVDPVGAVAADGAAYHTVTVHVHDAASCGDPVAGAPVTWTPDAQLQVVPGTTLPTATDTNGEAKASFVSTKVNTDPGWVVNVRVNGVLLNAQNAAPAYLTYQLSPDVVVDEPVRPGSYPITGTGTYVENGAPVTGAQVVVKDRDGNTVCTTTVQPDGTWSCVPVQPIPYDCDLWFEATLTDPATGLEAADTAATSDSCGCPDVLRKPTVIKVDSDVAVAADGVAAHTVTIEVNDSVTCQPVPGASIAWVPDSHLQVKPGTKADTVTDEKGVATVQYVSTSATADIGWAVNARVNAVVLGAENNAPVYLKYQAVGGADPQGNLNNIETRSGGVWVRGWAADNDAPLAVTQVLVSIGGELGKGETHTLDANLWRSDIPRTYPQFGEYHGFNQTLTTKVRGAAQVYVYAVNAPGTGGVSEKLIAIRSVTIGVDPQGNLNNIEVRPGGVWVRGWAADDDAPLATIQVVVSIGGELGQGESHTLVASLWRSDIPRTYPQFGTDHGFNQTLTSKLRGTQQVYVYAKNAVGTGGADKLIAVRTVTIS